MVSTNPSAPQREPWSQPAVRAFVELLGRVSSARAMREPSPSEWAAALDSFARERPALADELRRLAARWEELAPVRALVGSTPLVEALKNEYGDEVDPGVSLEALDEEAPTRKLATDAAGRSSGEPAGAARSRLPDSRSLQRYVVKQKIAEGGMGAIFRVFDVDLRRHLAMKVIRSGPPGATPPPSTAPSPPASRAQPLDPRTLARFLEEAQITGQLAHPGIVPVHELGVDADGRAYFTMRLVRGSTLREAIEWARSGRDGWNTTRALNVLLDVCEAVAFAHSRGVIHRDLKPTNVMVGRFGETCVMDWGLARVLGQDDRHDLRLQAAARAAGSFSEIRTDRSDAGESPESPLVTMDGTVVGTPSYMPLEQAEGRVHEVGPWSDVDSVGAMLYHLLMGQMPYVKSGTSVSARTVLARLLDGPPASLHDLNPDVPAELAAICEKAMARDFRARYPDTKALADDLRAFLERRVVRAYQTGAVAELRKWIERNRALAASLAAAILFLLAGAGAVAWIQDRARARVEIARTNEKLRADEAQKNLDDVNRLSDLKTLRDLVAEADTLWPAWSENVPRMQAWLERARALSARLPLHEASLARLRERALPFDESMVDAAIEADPELARRRDDLAHIETSARAHLMRHQQESVEEAVEREKLKPQGDNETDPDSIFEGHRSRLQEGADRAAKHMRRLHESVRARHRWRFDDEADQWWHDALATLVEDLHALSSAAGTPGSISEIEARIRHADGLTRQSVGEHAKAWREAIQSIASNAAYRGLELVQQPGLVPLEPDPASGLWEFWHVETGERPQRDSATGRWRMTDDVGIVFVLLPGGTFRMGCDPPGDGRTLGSPNVDPMSRIEEQPSHEMTLGPFLLSEYEWTRGQWRRATGRDPTEMVFGPGAWKTPLAAPVVNVSFNDCSSVLRRLGFEIPTEAQWEYAARAGSTTVFWCGDEPSSLATAANLGDRTFASSQNALHPEEPWSDGFGDLAPVGLLEPNRFGLHDVAGNVFEMCSDIFMSSSYGFFARNPDGRRIAMELLDVAEGSSCVVRGGSWFDTAMLARSAARFPRNCGDHAIVLGVRPARKLRQ